MDDTLFFVFTVFFFLLVLILLLKFAWVLGLFFFLMYSFGGSVFLKFTWDRVSQILFPLKYPQFYCHNLGLWSMLNQCVLLSIDSNE